MVSETDRCLTIQVSVWTHLVGLVAGCGDRQEPPVCIGRRITVAAGAQQYGSRRNTVTDRKASAHHRSHTLLPPGPDIFERQIRMTTSHTEKV